MYNKQDFEQMCSLYREWNGKINVISRKDIDNVYEHHILHSLAILEYLRREGESLEAQSFLDVGTGGGFPGVPLASQLPSCSFLLCDSIGKKVKVAAEVASALGLGNVDCVQTRAESLEGEFDWVVSRAVTSLDNFYPWVKGKYRKGILYLKGGDISGEISELCRKFHLNPSSIGVWPISDWLDDEYYAEKYVLRIKR